MPPITRTVLTVLAAACLLPAARSEAPVYPAASWQTRPPEQVGLSRDKLDALRGLVGGRGCVVRRGCLAYSWGDISKSADVASAVKLAHARGVLLAAAASDNLPVFEYEPRLVKKALVGYGQAEKEQVRAMVLSLLCRHRARIPLDAADALAVAICHIHARPPGSGTRDSAQ